MMKRALVVCALAAWTSATAQNEVDALRYSQLTFGGSARFTSMGGAFGALGGDISTLSFNPAGIAVYRKSELSFTPSIFTQTTSSTYNTLNSIDSKYNFNFSHLGLVAAFVNHNNDAANSGWVATNLGFGYNRTNNFHNRMDIVGYNADNSLLDVFASSATNTSWQDLDPFGSGLMFGAGLIDTVAGDSRYYYSIFPDSLEIKQHKSVETRGAMSETVLSFGGNYGNKLFIGASVGIPSVRYTEESYYEEQDENDSIPIFGMYRYYTDLSTTGRGVNFKLGLIYRIQDWVRLGAAVHTPTYFSLHDTYSNKVSVYYEDGSRYDTLSPEGLFDYQVITPMRAMGSIAFVIGKKALISGDYELVDYSYARLRSRPNVFYDVNPVIKEKYTATSNIRAGAEVRFDPVAFRAGYAFYGSPYKRGVNLDDAARTSYTAGVGFREGRKKDQGSGSKGEYFIDLAYVLTRFSENYYLYDPSVADPVRNDHTASSFLLTIGWKF